MVHSKHKGNAFENKILEDLREKFGYNSCHKTLGSGNSKDDKGDLVFLGKYLIECKHHKELRWKKLSEIWSKIKRESTNMRIEAEPIVIYRENRQPIMVMSLFNYNGKKLRAITSYNLWKQSIKVM